MFDLEAMFSMQEKGGREGDKESRHNVMEEESFHLHFFFKFFDLCCCRLRDLPHLHALHHYELE